VLRFKTGPTRSALALAQGRPSWQSSPVSYVFDKETYAPKPIGLAMVLLVAVPRRL
jgi:hypothetical protein